MGSSTNPKKGKIGNQDKELAKGVKVQGIVIIILSLSTTTLYYHTHTLLLLHTHVPKRATCAIRELPPAADPIVVAIVVDGCGAPVA